MLFESLCAEDEALRSFLKFACFEVFGGEEQHAVDKGIGAKMEGEQDIMEFHEGQLSQPHQVQKHQNWLVDLEVWDSVEIGGIVGDIDEAFHPTDGGRRFMFAAVGEVDEFHDWVQIQFAQALIGFQVPKEKLDIGEDFARLELAVYWLEQRVESMPKFIFNYFGISLVELGKGWEILFGALLIAAEVFHMAACIHHSRQKIP